MEAKKKGIGSEAWNTKLRQQPSQVTSSFWYDEQNMAADSVWTSEDTNSFWFIALTSLTFNYIHIRVFSYTATFKRHYF